MFYQGLYEQVRLTETRRKHFQISQSKYESALPEAYVDLTLSRSDGEVLAGTCLANELLGDNYSNCVVVVGDGGARKSTLHNYMLSVQYKECLETGSIEEPLMVEPTEFTEERGLMQLLSSTLRCRPDDVVTALCAGRRCLFIDKLYQLAFSCRETFISDISYLARVVGSLRPEFQC